MCKQRFRREMVNTEQYLRTGANDGANDLAAVLDMASKSQHKISTCDLTLR